MDPGRGVLRRSRLGPGAAAGLLALVQLLEARSLEAQAAPRPGRWHFIWSDEPKLRMTVLFTRTDAGDETRLLLQTAAGRFVLTSRQDPSESDSLESIRSLEVGEELSRRLILRGQDKVPACKDVVAPDPCVVVEGKNGSLAVALSQLSIESEPAATATSRPRTVAVAELRKRLLALSTEAFRKRLVDLAPVFPRSIELGRYADADFLGFLFPGVFRSGNSVGVRSGGCEFDAGFGFPCGEDERRREGARFGSNREAR